MRKLVIGLALSLFATAASAQWVLVSEYDGGKIYADPTTKRRTGNVVRIWTLHDYDKPLTAGEFTYYSARFYEQFNCVEQTDQSLQASLFAGKMLSGQVLFTTNEPSEKSFTAPNTKGAAMLEFACK